MPETAPFVFVSYASVDRERVLRIVEVLEPAGVRVWLDRSGIPGGAMYGAEINEGIKGCAAVMLMCTPASLASRNVRQEILLGWRHERPYLPLLLAPTTFPEEVAYWLEGSQWIEVLDRPDAEWLPQTLTAVRAFLARPAQQIPPVPAAQASSAPAAVDTSQSNLPTPLTSYVGRNREQGQLMELLLAPHGPRLVTLLGPGGTGKTRLAVELGHKLSGSFIDGAAFVPLAPIGDPALVPTTIATALEVRAIVGQPLLATIKAYLHTRRMLLILDNFEQVLDAAPVVSELLGACPRLRVIVTSRATLHVSGEHEYPVVPLDLPTGNGSALEHLANCASVALFVDRARAVRPGFELNVQNASAVAEICRRLDGLPLALELAAARVKMLGPPALLERLERRLPVLTGGARDLPARQQTIRNAIGWSYDLLSENERRLFRLLAVFAGGWSLESVAAVAAVDELDVLDGLTSLVDKSLVQRRELENGENRFTLLEMIREFAVEEIEATGQLEEARSRHASYFRAFAEGYRPAFWSDARSTSEEELIYLSDFEREHDNFRAALRWALDHDLDNTGLSLTRTLIRFWYHHCHYHEAYGWITRMLDRAAPIPSLTRGWVLYGKAMIGWEVYRAPDAMMAIEEALAIGRQLENDSLIAAVLLLQAVFELYDLQDTDRVEALLDEIPPAHRGPMHFAFRGASARLKGESDRATALYHEARGLARGYDLYPVYFAATYSGWLALDDGLVTEALSYARDAIDAARQLGHVLGQVEGIRIHACVAASASDHERAVRLFALADRLTQDLHFVYAEEIPQDRARAETLLAASRAALGEAAFEAAWQAGRALSLDAAVAYALTE